MERQAREAGREGALLRPNSTFNGQFTAGGAPWKRSELEAAYLWTLESREKRETRLAAVQSSVDEVTALRNDKQAELLLRLALAKQALRRLELRREVLDETVETYGKILEVYQRIPSRGPEQETSLAVMKIARAETELRIRALDIEEKEQLSELALLSGCESVSLPLKELVKAPRPSLSEGEGGGEGSTAVAKLEAERRVLESALRAEQSSYANDSSIGPMVSLQQEDDDSILAFGIQASIPLGNERAITLSRVRKAEAEAKGFAIDREKSRLAIARISWKKRYHEAEEALKAGMGYDEIARIHRKFETLFRTDRISAPLVIESHRQMYEHVAAYAELETKAVEALWTLRYLDGQLQGSDL